MLDKINSFLQVITIMTGIFMMTKYVFLEQGMDEKKQRIYYIVSYALVTLCAVIMPEGAVVVCVILGILNIFLGRKKNRIPGIFLMIPISGIINGAGSPIILLQLFFFQVGDIDQSFFFQLLLLLMYMVLGALLAVFYFKGKSWRSWFREKINNRRLLRSEYIILFISGSFLMTANLFLDMFFNELFIPDSIRSDTEVGVVMILGAYELASFLLAITIVVLILQGNYRKFYHDGVTGMQFSVIATMADIVENRDQNTGGHIKRTAKYVEIIGRNLRKQEKFPDVLTEKYLKDMIVAAPLHDIGKISIPDAVLNKPGRLTDEEFEIMKTHAAAGRDVLKKAEDQLGKFNYLNVALDMAAYHHEWWNGKGYPNGLSGEEIPLCARIMAVADVFDALTSKRCYKDPMPLEKAYGIIRSESGTHFDPAVAEIFLNSVNEIEQAMKELEGGKE